VIDRVAAHYADAEHAGPAGEAGARPSQDRLDGLTVDFGDWWCNLRPSNTEPLLRLNLEAQTRESCDDHVAELRALVEQENR
jgi:phosphomannomutase